MKNQFLVKKMCYKIQKYFLQINSGGRFIWKQVHDDNHFIKNSLHLHPNEVSSR